MTRFLGIATFLLCATFLAEDRTATDNTHQQGDVNTRKVSESKPNQEYLKLCTGNGGSFKQSSSAKLDNTTQAAYDLLRNKCATCHNPRSTIGAKSFSDILDSDDLIKHGILKAKDLKSRLLGRVEDGSMPADGDPLSDNEKKVLENWIKEGAKSFSTASQGIPDVGFISDEDFEACMVKDLRNIEEQDRPFIRYINLGNLYNAQRKAEIPRTTLALNKLINSLSWKKKITNPEVVDGTGTLLRIDLRNYKWTPEQWEEIVRANPYPQGLDNPKTRELSEMTKTGTPALRGDWLTFAASKPPLYHKLLGLPEKVGNIGADKALENILQVNTDQDEASGEVTKAGFKKSNVTKSNRIVNRYETPFGSYWKSDDFKTAEGKQNIFEHPNDYDRNGGEFIFNLPNGLQGYLVVDAKGNRLDEAPTDIVIDPLRIDKNGAVVNGISCISCHTKGMKRKDDEILPHFLNLEKLIKSNNSTDEKSLALLKDIDLVKKHYKDNQTLNTQYAEGEKIYADAIKKTGGDVNGEEPVFATTHAFEAPLDIRSMAAELGHEPKDVEELIKKDLTLQQKLQLGAAHTVDREVFNQNFRLLQGLLRGEVNVGGVPGIAFSDPKFDKHFEFVSVKPGTFKMGSPENEPEREGDEKQHQVTLTKGFEIQTTTVTQSLWEKVMGNNPSSFKGPNRPVENVSWNDINAKNVGFLDRLNKLRKEQGDRCTYRLPTEAEWEYAARGGNQIPDNQMETAYSFGNDVNKLKDFAWFNKNSGNQTHDVDDATKGTNPLGLHDMHGNVWQWCQDGYQVDISSLSPKDPLNNSGSVRVIRGGSWGSDAQGLRSANRGGFSADGRNGGVGFRLVRTCQ